MHHSEQLRVPSSGRSPAGAATRKKGRVRVWKTTRRESLPGHSPGAVSLAPTHCVGPSSRIQPHLELRATVAAAPGNRRRQGRPAAAIGLAGLHRFRLAHLSERSPISPRPHRGTPLPDLQINPAQELPTWPGKREARSHGVQGLSR